MNGRPLLPGEEEQPSPSSGTGRRRRRPPPPPLPIMLHEAIIIVWALCTLYRFIEITVEGPMDLREYYTQ